MRREEELTATSLMKSTRGNVFGFRYRRGCSFLHLIVGGLHRCLTVVLEWFYGHTEQLDPMEGDCPTPRHTKPSHQIPERLIVEAETPCPICDSTTRFGKFQCHVLPGLHRYLKVVLEWFCGHTEQLDPMEGDCPAPEDTNPSHHIPERLIVEAKTPCRICDSATRSGKLQCHVHELRAPSTRGMTNGGFLQPYNHF